MNSRKIIVDILNNVLYKGAYSNIELNKVLSTSTLSDADKGLVTEVVYGTIKYKYTLDSIIKKFVRDFKKIDKRVLNILRSSIYQIKYLDKIPSYAVVNESVNLAKSISINSSKFINGVLRNYLRNLENTDVSYENKIQEFCDRYSFESWMVKLFIDQYGISVAEDILVGLNERPVVTVRVNQAKTTLQEAFEMLKNKNYSVEEGEVCPEAIKIIKGGAIEANSLFKEGYFTVQDESAMLVAPLLDIIKDGIYLDLCAAPGGKSTHIAELLKNSGKVISFDIHEHKLNLIKQSHKRLGLHNIEVLLQDATKENSNFYNIADGVLMDVPCSGLGIIRKKPEIKWTKNAKELQELVKIQRSIMKNGWNYLKENGVLIYSTCTLNKKENENNIDWFLKQYPDAKCEPIFIGNNKNFIYNENGSLTIIPNNSMDGFFIAKLRKKSR